MRFLCKHPEIVKIGKCTNRDPGPMLRPHEWFRVRKKYWCIGKQIENIFRRYTTFSDM